MIRDENLRNVRRDAGLMGGNPKLKMNILLNQVDNQNIETKVKQKPTPSSSSSTSRSKTKDKTPLSPFEIPDWVPREEWFNFIHHRKHIKKPMSDQAQKIAITKLQKLRDQGEEISEVINQSILSGYPDLYPVKKQKGFSNAGATYTNKIDSRGNSFNERRDRVDAWLERESGDFESVSGNGESFESAQSDIS